MQHEGPPLETLTHRLTEAPPDFLAEPRIGRAGSVHVAAVIGDLLVSHGFAVSPEQLETFGGRDRSADRNRLSIALILCWLLADDWFRAAQKSGGAVLALIEEASRELSKQVASRKFVTDGERREELVRLALARLGFRPAGETVAQAQDRLTSLSSTERARVLRASREAEERARAIREALIRKAAEESADKWTRE